MIYATLFLNCSSSLSLCVRLTLHSNSVIPLGVDKWGCCEKKLGEKTMKSVSISSHCHKQLRSTSRCEILNTSMAAISDLQRILVLFLHTSRVFLMVKDERAYDDSYGDQITCFKSLRINRFNIFLWWGLSFRLVSSGCMKPNQDPFNVFCSDIIPIKYTVCSSRGFYFHT